MNEIKRGQNKFYIGDNEDSPKAELVYEYSEEGCIVITHTRVSEELRGQRIGQLLLGKMVDFAREENKKIIPVCPYAKGELLKNKAYEDVLKKDMI